MEFSNGIFFDCCSSIIKTGYVCNGCVRTFWFYLWFNLLVGIRLTNKIIQLDIYSKLYTVKNTKISAKDFFRY